MQVEVTQSGESWTLDFQAPNSGRLVPGLYPGAVSWPSQTDRLARPLGLRLRPGFQYDHRPVHGDPGGLRRLRQPHLVRGQLRAVRRRVHRRADRPGRLRLHRSAPRRRAGQRHRPNAGTTLTATLVSNPAHGTVVFNPDGSFSYAPAPGFIGTDSFTYQANDGSFSSNVATVTLTVASPVANNDSYSTDREHRAHGRRPGRAGQRHRPARPAADGRARRRSRPRHARAQRRRLVHLHPGRRTSSGPTASPTRPATARTTSDVATVTLTVGTAADGPGRPYTVEENSSLVGRRGLDLPDDGQPAGRRDRSGAVLRLHPGEQHHHGHRPDRRRLRQHRGGRRHDAHLDLDALFPGARPGPAHCPGSTISRADGRSSSPAPPAWRSSATAGGTRTSTASSSVTEATYDAGGNITAFAASFVQYSDGSDAALIGQVAYNSTRPATRRRAGQRFRPEHRDDALPPSRSPARATARSRSTPTASFLYTPTPGYVGTDSFTYEANDGYFDSNLATVTITVAVAGGERRQLHHDREHHALGQCAGRAGQRHQPVRHSADFRPRLGARARHASISSDGDGSFAYLPATNFVGTDTFTYEATDGIATSAPATVTIEVMSPSSATLDQDGHHDRRHVDRHLRRAGL